MKVKVSILLLIIALIGIVVISETNLGTVKVVDLLGREVEVPRNVERIVATGPGALRIMVYLNALDKIIGIEDFERRYPYGRPYILAHQELKELPIIGPGGPGKLPDLEKLLKLKPDVIFITYVNKRIADSIQSKVKIPVIVLGYGSLRTFEDEILFDSLRLAGKILERSKRAEEVISFIKGVQKDLKNRVEGLKSPTAYVGGIGYRGAHGIDSTKPNYPAFNVLNIENVAAKINQDHVFIDKEQLLNWQPDFIFVDEGGLKLIEEDYSKNPGFYKFLEAFKKGRIYGILPYNYYTTNIGTALADAYFIGKVVYPERFEDIVPAKKADEIYKFLNGKAVYDEMKEQFGGFGRLDLEKRIVVPIR